MDRMTDTTFETLSRNYRTLRETVDQACAKSGRSGEEVRIVAVTKYVEAEIVRGLMELGLNDFGENRIQVAEAKFAALSGLPIRWHWIGNLQTNKVRKVIGRFHEFHSIDRDDLIEAIDKRLDAHPEERPSTKIPSYLQVNVSGEDTKSGYSDTTIDQGAEKILDSEYLEWVGLMTMAPYDADPEETRPVFAGLRELRDRLSSKFGVPLPRLSMGMSNDFPIAVEEGATDIRVGRQLFEGLL